MSNASTSQLFNRLAFELDRRFTQCCAPVSRSAFEPLGVSVKAVRGALVEILLQREAEQVPHQVLLSVSLQMLRCDDPVKKVAGMLLIQDRLLPAGGIRWHREMRRFEHLFLDGCLSDWTICDRFAIRVLAPLLEQHGVALASHLHRWGRSSNLWLRRASVVTFAHLARQGERLFPGFVEYVLATCRLVVRSPEKLHQSGVGWALRELSKNDKQVVIHFLRNELRQDQVDIHAPIFAKMSDDLKTCLGVKRGGEISVTQAAAD